MWGNLRSGALWVTRPARKVYNGRKKFVREFAPAPRLVVRFAADIESAKLPWLHSALAFSVQSVELTIIEETSPPNGSMGTFLSVLETEQPSYYFFIGREPITEEIAALKLLQIPYRAVTDLTPPNEMSEFPNEDPQRAKWHAAFERRPVIYAHLVRDDNLALIIEAFRVARRNFPNLIMIMSGIKEDKIKAAARGLFVGTENKNIKTIRFLDIMVMEDLSFSTIQSSVSSAQIVTQTRDIREITKEAIKHSTAVIFYDVRSSSLSPFSDLINSGSIWNVTRKGSLGATISQVLRIEIAANTATQSILRLHTDHNPTLDALDELLSIERAA